MSDFFIFTLVAGPDAVGSSHFHSHGEQDVKHSSHQDLQLVSQSFNTAWYSFTGN
jgi:hypothetical protein